MPAQIGALHEQLIDRAAATPVLVCLDGLQWAGPASLLALRVLPGRWPGTGWPGSWPGRPPGQAAPWTCCSPAWSGWRHPAQAHPAQR